MVKAVCEGNEACFDAPFRTDVFLAPDDALSVPKSSHFEPPGVTDGCRLGQPHIESKNRPVVMPVSDPFSPSIKS